MVIFVEHMAKVEENIRKAIPHAANEHQKKMLEAYAESFQTGSIDAHKERYFLVLVSSIIS